jgi:carboxypeptidase Taq
VSPQIAALREYADELRALGGALSLLSWDERTQLPAAGGSWRARQMATLSGIYHKQLISTDLERLISAAEDAHPGSAEVRVMRRDYEHATKLPSRLVREFSEASSLSQQAWAQARRDDDFTTLQPHLERVLELSHERAECYGYETERYDALHDLYEQDSRAAELEPMFEGLREPLLELIDAQPPADLSILRRTYPLDAQTRFGEWIVTQVGYDMASGRLDPTAHPFCTSIGRGDVRLTTRYDEEWLPGSLFATIHEAGHGIYGQAFDRLELPSTYGEAPGLGMHESQSRMYENIVARSTPFWERYFPDLQAAFPGTLDDVDMETFLRQVRVSERSLIRVEADELTYNLHIAARFELERSLVNGTLAVKDLPEAWRDAYQRWVGLVPDNDRDGVLQDVHWSSGSFGYFPTYTLGNVYAAQFVERCRQDITNLDDQWRAGEFGPLRDWFDEHVYQHGRLYSGREFVQRITGGGVSSAALVTYLRERFAG